MPEQNTESVRPEVSVIRPEVSTVGACEHLRLEAPFSWLQRHEDWPPLNYALQRGTCAAGWRRRLRRGGDLLLGHGYRSTWARAVLGGAPRGWMLTPSFGAQALLILRETTPELCEDALLLARQRHLPLVYDTDDLLLALADDSPLAGKYRAMRPLLQRMIRQADHLTVANAQLAEELAELNPSISVLPSFMDADLWGVSEIAPPGDGPISIGYWGSSVHIPDLQAFTAAFRHLKQRYGRRIRFQFMGCHDPEMLALEDVSVGDYLPSYAAYAQATRDCRLDIAIAPLATHRFNRCKSPIKFFEYGIRGACGIYADLEPYQTVVRHGENGFRIGPDMEQWVGALEQLVDHPEQRYRMARQAQNDVLAHHTLDRQAWRWREAYTKVTERFSSQAALCGS